MRATRAKLFQKPVHAAPRRRRRAQAWQASHSHQRGDLLVHATREPVPGPGARLRLPAARSPRRGAGTPRPRPSDAAPPTLMRGRSLDEEARRLADGHRALVTDRVLEPLASDAEDTQRWMDCDLASFVENRLFETMDPTM